MNTTAPLPPDNAPSDAVAQLAQRIYAQHARTFEGHPPVPLDTALLTRQWANTIAAQEIIETSAQASTIYAAALQAASQLGFIAVDSQIIAQAWVARAARTANWQDTSWPDNRADFGMEPTEIIEARHGAFASCPRKLGLYAVLPDANWVQRMAQAGVPTLQLRFKSDNKAAIASQVRQSVAAVQGTQSRLFINDHWQEAIEAGAWGIHLGQEDLDALPESALQSIRQSGLRLGISTHGYAEMVRAAHIAPSYMALGAVFPTTLKKMATAPQGLGRLYAYARLMQHLPLVAIGGIGEAQFTSVLQSGVGSIAVVRAIVNAPNPEAAAMHLNQLMQQASEISLG